MPNYNRENSNINLNLLIVSSTGKFMDPDQARHIVRPDLCPNCLTLAVVL